MKTYYFGCNRESGHYFYGPGMESMGARAPEVLLPFRWAILDGGLQSQRRGEQHNEYAPPLLSHIGGWTVLAMWDNSVDRRPASCAAFVMEGTHTQAEVVDQARLDFPDIVKRLKALASPGDRQEQP